MPHQMTVMMTQNITRCHLKTQAVVKCAKTTPNAAVKLFSFKYFKVFCSSFWKISLREYNLYKNRNNQKPYVINKNQTCKMVALLKSLKIQWTLSNSNSQEEFEFVRIMGSSD